MLNSLSFPVSYRGLAPHYNHAHDGRTQRDERERRRASVLKSKDFYSPPVIPNVRQENRTRTQCNGTRTRTRKER